MVTGAAGAILAAAILALLETITGWLGRLVAPTVPEGSVIAFDRSDLDQDTCPTGWKPFKESRGRMIVGAGDAKISECQADPTHRDPQLGKDGLMGDPSPRLRETGGAAAELRECPMTPYAADPSGGCDVPVLRQWPRARFRRAALASVAIRPHGQGVSVPGPACNATRHGSEASSIPGGFPGRRTGP